jgi:hypothetical protein
MQQLKGSQSHELQLGENYLAFLAWQTQQDFVVNVVPIIIGMRGALFGIVRPYFLATLGLLGSVHAV